MKITPRFFIILTALGLSSCAVNPVTGQSQLALVSERSEYDQGDKTIRAVLKEVGEYQDAGLQNYLNDLGTKLVKVTERADKPFNFYVADGGEVNALATPGHIVFFRGLLPYLNSEAELMSVLGHEVGHITARHSVRQQTTGILTQIGLIALQAAVGTQTQSQAAVDLTGQLGGAIASVGFASYGRGMELEADRLGARYMAASGYNPAEAKDVFYTFTRLRELQEKITTSAGLPAPTVGFERVLSTHPADEQRIAQLLQEVGATAPDTNQGRARLLAQLDGLAFGPGPKEGIRTRSTFYAPQTQAKITFPANFTLALSPGAGFAAFDPTTQARVQLIAAEMPHDFKLTDALADLASGLGRVEAFTTQGGYPAITGVKTYTERGQSRQLRAFVLQDKATKTGFDGVPTNKRAMFAGVFSVPTEHFAAQDGLFWQAWHSFRRLTPAQAKAVQPLRLRVVTVKAGDTVEKLAARLPTGSFQTEWFRLLNGLEPTATLKPGQQVKVFVDPNG